MTEVYPQCGFDLDGDCDQAPACSDCGCELKGSSDEDDEVSLCVECAAGRDAAIAYEAIEDGELEMASEVLSSHYSAKKNVVTDLITEADYYARRGDFDEVDMDVPEFAGVIIPADACSEIVRIAGEGELTIRVSERLIEAQAPRRRYVSKLMDATFPDYNPVIPMSDPPAFSIEVADIESALARLSSAGESKSPSVRFSWGDDVECLRLQRRGDNGEGAEDVACICDGRPAGEIGFNGDYVRKILEASGGARARLYFDEPNLPARVVNPDDPDFVSVIMPMRV